jgi:tetratricopeptide (TPR) repeat protein
MMFFKTLSLILFVLVEIENAVASPPTNEIPEAGQVHHPCADTPLSSVSQPGTSVSQNDDHFFHLALKHFMRGEFEEAIRCCDRAISINGEVAAYYMRRAFCYLKRTNFADSSDFESALRDTEKAIEIEPDNVNTRAFLGLIHLQYQRYDQAVRILEDTLHFAEEKNASSKEKDVTIRLLESTRELKKWLAVSDDALKEAEKVLVRGRMGEEEGTDRKPE